MLKKFLLIISFTLFSMQTQAKVDDACQFVWAKNYCLDGVWVERPNIYRKLTDDEKKEYMKELKPVLEAWSDASDAGDKVKEYELFEKKHDITHKWGLKLLKEKRD